MNRLETGTIAPTFAATNLDGNRLDLEVAIKEGPVIICFAHPIIHASRLVVGYLRKMAEIAPKVTVWIISEGNENETREYVGMGEAKYLTMPVVVDNCQITKLYSVSHVPSIYLIDQTGKIIHSYVGFNKPFLNNMAEDAAKLTGTAAKELVTDSDNKGFYELAEKISC